MDAFQRVDELQCQLYDLEAKTDEKNYSAGMDLICMIIGTLMYACMC